MAGKIFSLGRTYLVDDTGQISTDNGESYNENWRVLGAVRLNNFGNEAEQVSFSDLPALNNQWHHKNGRQRWHLYDFDHGTRRVWGGSHYAIFEVM